MDNDVWQIKEVSKNILAFPKLVINGYISEQRELQSNFRSINNAYIIFDDDVYKSESDYD